MPKICYQSKKLSDGNLETIEQANGILEEYSGKGFVLTLRQLYYQFVARGLIENSEREYKCIGNAVNDGRMAGLIDWEHLIDRTRMLRSESHWDSVASMLEACAEQYRMDRWAGQETYIEVHVEKDALIGVVELACSPLDVGHISCRGYASASELWAAANRITKQILDGRQVVLLYLGDHDPSGMDMSRDVESRLRVFADENLHGSSLESFLFLRIALNMGQIEKWKPPANPAKQSDSRFSGYHEKYGDESWELDALAPETIVSIIREEVIRYIEPRVWAAWVEREKAGRKRLKELAESERKRRKAKRDRDGKTE
jgi:hypothetical protein